MLTVPKVNTHSVLVDLRRPDFNYGGLAGRAVVNLIQVGSKQSRSGGARRGGLVLALVGGSLVVALSSVFWFLVWLGQVGEVVSEKGKRVAANLSESAGLVRDFDSRRAAEVLRENDSELEGIVGIFSGWKGKVISSGLGEVLPVVADAADFMREVSRLNGLLFNFAEQIADLQTNGLHYLESDGAALIRALGAANDSADGTLEAMTGIQNIASRLDKNSGAFSEINKKINEEYLANVSRLREVKDFLGGLAGFLDTKEDKRILLIFQNNSEIRPGGGFIGSYGVLTINGGQMMDLKVEDIYWPDHPKNFTLKVKPPEPLQWIVTDWAARDANWFLDFPESAEHVMNFLEASKIYREAGVRFDGAVALNTDVLGSVLTLVGEVSVPDYGLTLTSENFLEEIQREVETGRDKAEGENPKKILSVVAPEILNRLWSLSADERSALLGLITEHVRHKDIMIYMRASGLNRFLRQAEVDGSVYALPTNFWGSYLAVVDANIKGEKSDAFVSQEIDGRIDVATDGGAFSDFTIRRIHAGGREKDPWYNVENMNYIQIYVNPEAQLVSLDGNAVRGKPRGIDYEGKGYTVDLFNEQIENTAIYLTNFDAWAMKAFGKAVVAAWFNTPAGQTRELKVRYTTPAENALVVKDGARYEFIFDRQSGVKTTLKIVVSAPIGYTWRESESPIYTFQTVNPLTRERVILHLLKK